MIQLRLMKVIVAFTKLITFATMLLQKWETIVHATVTVPMSMVSDFVRVTRNRDEYSRARHNPI